MRRKHPFGCWCTGCLGRDLHPGRGDDYRADDGFADKFSDPDLGRDFDEEV